jgi:predicted amidohydrolase YtcJ
MSSRGVVLTGGPIYTMNGSTVEAVRLDGDRISLVGTLDSAMASGAAEVVDLAGRCLLPGFVDAHTHPLMLGQCMTWADLSTASSIDEVVKILREHAVGLDRTSPIRGFGYDQHRFTDDRHPTAVDLDRVSEDVTVTIMHASGHGYVVNSSGLDTAGIRAGVPTPTGGLIDRDEYGNPTGRVFDAACDLLTGTDGTKVGNHGPNLHIPDTSEALAAQLDIAQGSLLSAGITSVGDCQVTDRELSTYVDSREAGRLRLRVTMYVLSSHVALVERHGLDSGLSDDHLGFGGIKHYADGSLVSGTAYLPCGCGATHGYLYHEDGELEELIDASNALGRQTATHAQGPEAIQLVLDALGRREPRPGLRHRIEHCGFPTDDQIVEMRRLGVVPVPQPTQVHLYGEGVRRDHPEQAERMYASGLFAREGLPVVLSSDTPVTRPDVMLACWCAETRLTAQGRVLGAEAKLTRLQALEGYTRGGAHALRRDDVGSIQVGNFSDLVVLTDDPLAVPVDTLPGITVDETWVDGRPAWSAAEGLI